MALIPANWFLPKHHECAEPSVRRLAVSLLRRVSHAGGKGAGEADETRAHVVY